MVKQVVRMILILVLSKYALYQSYSIPPVQTIMINVLDILTNMFNAFLFGIFLNSDTTVVTTGYYRSMQVTRGYYRLLQVTTA